MAKLDSFEAFLSNLSGDRAFSLQLRFDNAQHEGRFRDTGNGTFVLGKDSVDISESYLGNIHGTGARWAAFLYLVYVKLCRKNGVTPGEFTDEWNDIYFEDGE
jgi:hypothetical protein